MKTSRQSTTDAIRELAGRPRAALFLGAPGAGKNAAAQALARELGMPLRRIDLGRVVSRYVGETEKNIDRIFDDASEQGAVLIFDEADALFGKRTGVGDAHDRYAAANHLLDRLEAHRGAAVITASSRQALDPAFLRRLRTVIEFRSPSRKRANSEE